MIDFLAKRYQTKCRNLPYAMNKPPISFTATASMGHTKEISLGSKTTTTKTILTFTTLYEIIKRQYSKPILWSKKCARIKRDLEYNGYYVNNFRLIVAVILLAKYLKSPHPLNACASLI